MIISAANCDKLRKIYIWYLKNCDYSNYWFHCLTGLMQPLLCHLGTASNHSAARKGDSLDSDHIEVGIPKPKFLFLDQSFLLEGFETSFPFFHFLTLKLVVFIILQC